MLLTAILVPLFEISSSFFRYDVHESEWEGQRKRERYNIKNHTHALEHCQVFYLLSLPLECNRNESSLLVRSRQVDIISRERIQREREEIRCLSLDHRLCQKSTESERTDDKSLSLISFQFRDKSSTNEWVKCVSDWKKSLWTLFQQACVTLTKLIVNCGGGGGGRRTEQNTTRKFNRCKLVRFLARVFPWLLWDRKYLSLRRDKFSPCLFKKPNAGCVFFVVVHDRTASMHIHAHLESQSQDFFQLVEARREREREKVKECGRDVCVCSFFLSCCYWCTTRLFGSNKSMQ